MIINEILDAYAFDKINTYTKFFGAYYTYLGKSNGENIYRVKITKSFNKWAVDIRIDNRLITNNLCHTLKECKKWASDWVQNWGD